MSEAKGPYFVTKQVDDEMGSRWFLINGPGISDPRTTATADFDEAMMARDFRNIGWKEGRTSRDRLLEHIRLAIGKIDDNNPMEAREWLSLALEADGEGE